jgi:hypothetical protein
MIIRYIFVALCAISVAVSASGQAGTSTYCPKNDVVVKCRKALVPFRYTNMVVKRVIYKSSNSFEEFSIPLYYDARYRFVFNTELLPLDVKFEIYDKPRTEKKREKLFEASSSEKQFNFEPEAMKGISEIYVNVLVPAYISEEGKSFERGCFILMTGYEDEVSDAFGNADGGKAAGK